MNRQGMCPIAACSMPYNIADPDREIDDLVVRQAHVFREKQQLDLRTEHRVEIIDPDSKIIGNVQKCLHGDILTAKISILK